MTESFHVVVVGAGLLGLSTAYQLLSRRPDLRVTVLDKEDRVAAHQSSHNSGVIHSGVYYAPGSLKAQLCLAGKVELEEFADRHSIPYERCGKLIVALGPGEFERLHALKERAVGNGVQGVTELGPEEIKEVEPYAAGARALLIPGTAIIDFARVAGAYAEEVVARGGQVLLGRRVGSITGHGGRRVVATSGGDVVADGVITCAGLHADRVGSTDSNGEGAQIVPFRGDYYTLVPAARHLVRGLIYPVPDPSLPFLGVHFTKRIDGEVWAGPNAVLALAREGYGRTTTNLRDLAGTLAFPGFWRLARRYWRTGAEEVWRDIVKAAFVRELQRYVPAVSASDLVFGPSGVRAQAVGPDGRMVDDFSIATSATLIQVRNAPSPGATASLAIGRHLADLALGTFAVGEGL